MRPWVCLFPCLWYYLKQSNVSVNSQSGLANLTLLCATRDTLLKGSRTLGDSRLDQKLIRSVKSARAVLHLVSQAPCRAISEVILRAYARHVWSGALLRDSRGPCKWWSGGLAPFDMGNEKNRGEIGEIRTQLNALSSSGSRPEAAAAKKELFKKVINCMTIGIDMSSLFMQVMTAGMSNAEDVVLKKMLYLFICTYAQSNPDLTLLTINLLNKDCKDQDPTIRGLALRSLCSLRVANLIEYIVSTLYLLVSCFS